MFIPKNAHEQIFVGHNELVGRDFVDVRIYCVQGGHRFPTKRGVMIPIASLPAVIEALTELQSASARGSKA